MKKSIILLFILSSLLLANSIPLVIKSFHTNENIKINDIMQYNSKFNKEQTQDEKDLEFEIVLFDSEENSTLKQNDTKKYTWLMIDLDENLSSGNYWIEHTNFVFANHTFTRQQSVDKFSFLGRKFFSFTYNKSKNNKRYFFKVIPKKSHVVAKASLYTPQNFSRWANDYSIKLLFYFFLFGLIFMTAIYNGALYIYNKEKSFLYYMFMQIFMLGVLVYQLDIINIYVMGNIENEEIAIFFYFIIVEVAIIFILYFIRAFLETKKYLPFHDKVLHYITLFAWFDLVLFFVPIMLILQIYSFTLLYVVIVAGLRFKQGYKPALFFLFGWSALMVGVFVSDFFSEDILPINPIVIGSTIEAFFLAMAISYKINEIKKDKENQQEILIHQSKLASMGELLGNIAHQWRQPLTRMGYILMNIEAKDKENHHLKKIEEASHQLEFMSQTIDDFRSFYKPDKKKELFSLANESKKVIELISFENIELKLIIVEDTEILNYKNEYKQVLLNLLTNAKDIINERKIKSGKITIKIEPKSVCVSDNAGGISPKLMEKIFEPYFTTKDKGMGIGLYMSKMIVEQNMGGELKVSNTKNGALFSLENF